MIRPASDTDFDPDRLREVITAVCQAAMAQEVAEHVRSRASRTRGRSAWASQRAQASDAGDADGRVEIERAAARLSSPKSGSGLRPRAVPPELVRAMTASWVAAEIEEKLATFRSRKLHGVAYPYVKVDAI